jgi:hypothetical protein
MCDAEIGWRKVVSKNKSIQEPSSEYFAFDSNNSSSNILLNTRIRYIADTDLDTYSLNKDDLESKTIKEVSEDIKIQKQIDDGDFISDEHNSYSNLKSDFLPINQEDKISVLVNNSNQKPTINFIHNMRDWMNKKDEEITNLKKRLERIEKSSTQEILIRQLRKDMKEKFFFDLSQIYTEMNENSWRDNCKFVINKLEQDPKSILSYLRGWSHRELLLLFDGELNFELNRVAHPKFEDQANLKDLKEACDSMGDEDLKELHNKIYDTLHGKARNINLPSSSNTTNFSIKKRSGTK